MEWTIAFFDQPEKLPVASHSDIGIIAFDHAKITVILVIRVLSLLTFSFVNRCKYLCINIVNVSLNLYY